MTIAVDSDVKQQNKKSHERWERINLVTVPHHNV